MIIVCQSWLWADLGSPGVCVCLCVCLCVLTGVELWILWQSVSTNSLHPDYSRLILSSTLCACWALADRPIASLFIYLRLPLLLQKEIFKTLKRDHNDNYINTEILVQPIIYQNHWNISYIFLFGVPPPGHQTIHNCNLYKCRVNYEIMYWNYRRKRHVSHEKSMLFRRCKKYDPSKPPQGWDTDWL